MKWMEYCYKEYRRKELGITISQYSDTGKTPHGRSSVTSSAKGAQYD